MSCPKCGKDYTGVPVISRADNKTNICLRCGFVEGLEAAGHTGEKMEALVKAFDDSAEIIMEYLNGKYDGGILQRKRAYAIMPIGKSDESPYDKNENPGDGGLQGFLFRFWQGGLCPRLVAFTFYLCPAICR